MALSGTLNAKDLAVSFGRSWLLPRLVRPVANCGIGPSRAHARKTAQDESHPTWLVHDLEHYPAAVIASSVARAVEIAGGVTD